MEGRVWPDSNFTERDLGEFHIRFSDTKLTHQTIANKKKQKKEEKENGSHNADVSRRVI